jgi:hypothetical protein
MPHDQPGRPLLTLRGIVEAPVDLVTPLVVDEPVDSAVKIVERDHAARTIALQGGWWYRGETRLEPHESGTLVVHQVFNVATTSRWASWFVARKPLRATEAGFADRLRALGGKLHCRAYALPPDR